MRFQLQHTILLSLASFVLADDTHYDPPREDNVESPFFCRTNDQGFAGLPISDTYEVATNNFFYELQFEGENPTTEETQAAIDETERRIVDYLLETQTGIFTICDPSGNEDGANAVAVTVNPEDLALEGVSCELTTPLPGTTCVVVMGAYQVYFPPNTVGISDAMATLNNAVETGMDDNAFVGGDITKVTWSDDPEDRAGESNKPDDSETIDVTPDDNSSSAPAIVGASVGGILAIGLVAFYRRRNIKGADDETMTGAPDGNSAPPV